MGTTINMHYCMNQFAGWSLISKQQDKCPKCGMTNTGCCKDEKKQIKLSLDQQKSTAHQIYNQPLLIVLPIKCTYLNALTNRQSIQLITYLHSPPILLHQQRQALFSTFLI